MNDGLWTVLVFPSPKFQLHDVGELDEVSVNCTVRGAVPDVGVPLKLATGDGVTVGVGVAVGVAVGKVVVESSAATGMAIPTINMRTRKIGI